MSCLYPRYIYIEPPNILHPDKQKVIFTSPKPDKKYMHCTFVESGEYQDAIQIPCGQCIECRKAKARSWANRLTLEMSTYPQKQCWFVTLTFDDEHIQDHFASSEKVWNRSTQCYEDDNWYTLRKSDVQNFMKRLRQYCSYNKLSDNIRFFACGEYGDEGHRPHYHLILMGVDLWKMPIEFLGYNDTGNPQWNSSLLSQVWPFGFNVAEEACWANACYCAGYVVKKLTGKLSSYYDERKIEPEFSLMSRRPGIAHDWYIENKDSIKESDGYVIPGRPVRCKPDRYCDSVLFSDDPFVLAEIKRLRKERFESVPDSLDRITGYLNDPCSPRLRMDIPSYAEVKSNSEATSHRNKFKKY